MIRLFFLLIQYFLVRSVENTHLWRNLYTRHACEEKEEIAFLYTRKIHIKNGFNYGLGICYLMLCQTFLLFSPRYECTQIIKFNCKKFAENYTPYLWPNNGLNSSSINPQPTFHFHTLMVLSLRKMLN